MKLKIWILVSSLTYITIHLNNMLSYDFNKSIECTWQQSEHLVSNYLFNYKKHLFFKVFFYMNNLTFIKKKRNLIYHEPMQTQIILEFSTIYVT